MLTQGYNLVLKHSFASIILNFNLFIFLRHVDLQSGVGFQLMTLIFAADKLRSLAHR